MNENPYLTPTWFIDSDNPEVLAYAQKLTANADTAQAKAVQLFYGVRDDVRYNPYHMSTDPAHMKASQVLRERVGYCIPKAILLAACARAVGIASRLGFADVRNHLTTEKLREQMGTDIFIYHGYTELYLGDTWVKATPTFNRALCEKFGVKTLEFDGVHDAILQPFDCDGARHMEYMRDHGTFDDVPFEMLIREIEAAYPSMFKALPKGVDAQW